MHIRSFLIKWIMILAVLWIVLGGYFEVDFIDILITSVAVTVIGYVADRYLLPRTGNVMAAVIDFVMAWAIIWFLGSFLYDDDTNAINTAAFISALIITVGELLFHRYMRDKVSNESETAEGDRPNTNKGYYQQTDLRTEFAEEEDMDSAKKAKEKDQAMQADNDQSNNK